MCVFYFCSYIRLGLSLTSVNLISKIKVNFLYVRILQDGKSKFVSMFLFLNEAVLILLCTGISEQEFKLYTPARLRVVLTSCLLLLEVKLRARSSSIMKPQTSLENIKWKNTVSEPAANPDP